ESLPLRLTFLTKKSQTVLSERSRASSEAASAGHVRQGKFYRMPKPLASAPYHKKMLQHRATRGVIY
ncbi:MAG: hypothetical protein ABIA66_01850, partial [Candidatus Omnitrophota bacterium]